MRKILLASLFASLFCNAIFAQTDRDALMALYNATDGPNWTVNTNWGSAAPLNTWFGVQTDINGRVVVLNLGDINFAGNNLNGTLPAEIGDLTFLLTLIITDNPGLTGPIPNSLANLIDLTRLSFRNNNLNGTIPANIGNLVNLRTLELNVNEFLGLIPPSIGNLASLEYISLNSSSFDGTIPEEIGNLSNLTYLDLNNAGLTGTIPASLANLQNLQNLLLYSNELSGEIPTFLATMPNLRVVSISANQFTGEIPPELGSMINLEQLTIGINNLEGTIPETFGNLINLRVLDVHFANLSGELPASLSQLTNLTSLSLQLNNFEGDLPTINLDTSRPTPPVLNIRGNRFHFGDFEDEFNDYNSPAINFIYDRQAMVNEVELVASCSGESITLSTTVRGSANVYEWFRDGVPIPNSNTADLVIETPQNTDAGVYTCLITSTIVTGLTLERNPITVGIGGANVPVANPVSDSYACDTDNDGFAEFEIDLAAINDQVLGGQTGYPVSYFDQLGAPIDLTGTYTNTTITEELITVRIGDAASCFDETTFSLITVPGIAADSLEDVAECNFVLPNLSAGNTYYTEPDQQGSELPSGSVINTTQTIYIYAESNSPEIVCSDETSFTVTIDPLSCDTADTTLLPRFFTPNNDGANDFWDVSALIGNNTTVFIFNRYGQLLQQIDPDATQGWDGNYNGAELPASDYWYRYFDTQTGKQVKGHFSLKR